jgi:hypothetical protein
MAEEIISLGLMGAKVVGKVTGKADDIPESMASKVNRKGRGWIENMKESQEDEEDKEKPPTPQIASTDATAVPSDGDSGCCCCCCEDDCCCGISGCCCM